MMARRVPQRCISNSLYNSAPINLFSLPVQIQSRNASTAKIRPNKHRKTLLVQLIKDVPRLGFRGDVVSVRAGVMRNALYPFSKARYIRPGSDTFLTKQKLAVPLIPGNEVPSRNESDPFRMEFKQLLENTRKRLIQHEIRRPDRNAREKVLNILRKHQTHVWKDPEWTKEEREELMRFLGIQATAFGMLEDNLGSKKLRDVKENMLLRTWGKFIQGMRQAKNEKEVEEPSLASMPSTSGSILQGNIKTVTEGVETTLGSAAPITQTASTADSGSEERKFKKKNETEKTEKLEQEITQ